MPFMDTIVTAKPLPEYKIYIVTSSGIEGIFDVSPYLQSNYFQQLKNPSYFRQVRPAHHGIAWPDEQDFSADTIIWDIKKSQQ
jgi:hypothetical protein